MNYYMLTGDGRQIGPVTAEELIKLGLTRETMVWHQGLDSWIPSSQVPELANLLISVPPCPPEPPSFNQPQNNSYSSGPYPQNITFNNQQANQSQNSPHELTAKPNNYIIWAILSTILCCVPFGIVSIVYASKVNILWRSGRYNEAKEASENAKGWALFSFAIGFVIFSVAFIKTIAET